MSPRRRWDDPWQQYPASKPLKAEGGVATRKQRGAMASAWWSKRFVDVLESYGLGARMQRGRRYARSGQLLSIEVTAGLIAAQVQGSRRKPYLVTIQSRQPDEAAWARLDDVVRSQVGFAARLLAGEVPPELEDACADAGFALFPARWSDLTASCNCPDWENPCKHIAATLYLYADQLDDDPWPLLRWRGRTKEQLLGHLTAPQTAPRPTGIPPWWPLIPSAAPGPAPAIAGVPIATPPEPPDRVLQRLDPLDADVAGQPITALVAAAYERLADAAAADALPPSG